MSHMQVQTYANNQVFGGLLSQFIETLQQELLHHRRLLNVVRRKKSLITDDNVTDRDSLLQIERDALADLVTVERDRLALVEALGQILGHPEPSRVRIAELVLHAEPEGRDELLDLRDDLRDVADEFDALTAVDRRFSRHFLGNIRLYVDSDVEDATVELPPAETGVSAPESTSP